MANRILVTCVSATGVCFAIYQIAGSLLTPHSADLSLPRRRESILFAERRSSMHMVTLTLPWGQTPKVEASRSSNP
jgi:hypothetical protein